MLWSMRMIFLSSSQSQTLKYFGSAGVIMLHLMDHPAMNIFMHSCNTLRGHIEQQRDRMKRKGQRFHPKTTFKRILCPDHAVGVLRYITCRDGQRATRRNDDGLHGAPHTHYRRSVHGKWLLHNRSKKKQLGCADIRFGILRYLKQKLDEKWLKDNVSGHLEHLHHHETCVCEFGKIGRRRRRLLTSKEEISTIQKEDRI